MQKYEGNPDYKGQNTAELICLNCDHKFGWHHAKPTKTSTRICYGIACICDGFYHNLCCLVPAFEKVIKNK